MALLRIRFALPAVFSVEIPICLGALTRIIKVVFEIVGRHILASACVWIVIVKVHRSPHSVLMIGMQVYSARPGLFLIVPKKSSH
jgi:hypothetical protein